MRYALFAWCWVFPHWKRGESGRSARDNSSLVFVYKLQYPKLIAKFFDHSHFEIIRLAILKGGKHFILTFLPKSHSISSKILNFFFQSWLKKLNFKIIPRKSHGVGLVMALAISSELKNKNAKIFIRWSENDRKVEIIVFFLL